MASVSAPLGVSLSPARRAGTRVLPPLLLSPLMLLLLLLLLLLVTPCHLASGQELPTNGVNGASTVTSAATGTATAPIPSPMPLMGRSDGGRARLCPAAPSTMK
ncbi:hypothetical protein INR49_000557 [Caranx melampygus]|nr:hypothetical protein INR49_000557 [Caranx melampygus]